MTRRAARISAVLAEIDHREGHPAEAVARLEAALEALASEEPDEDTAAVAAQLGRFLVLSNRYEDAAPRLELALELSEALGLPEVFAQALTSKSILYTARTGWRRRASCSRGRSTSHSRTTCTPPRFGRSTTWRSTTSRATGTGTRSTLPTGASSSRGTSATGSGRRSFSTGR